MFYVRTYFQILSSAHMTLQEWFFYLIFLIPFCRDDLFHLVNKENFLSLIVSNITNFLLQGWYVCKDDFFTWSIRRIQRMTEKHHHWTILQTCNFWIEIIREVITVQDNNPKITIPWHFWQGLSLLVFSIKCPKDTFSPTLWTIEP